MLLVVSCQDQSEYDFPLVLTGDVRDITTDGALFNGKIVDLGAGPVLEYGFVWDTRANPTYANAERFAVEEAPEIGVYEQRITTALNNGETYFVRAYMRSEQFITYGKSVAFRALGGMPPELIGFTPTMGNLGDTILIFGNNFSYFNEKNRVFIGDIESQVILSTQDSLAVIVPETLARPESEVIVSIYDEAATIEERFTLISPEITSVHPESGLFNTVVMVEGTNFLSHPSSLMAFVGDYRAEIVDTLDHQISILLPDSLDAQVSSVSIWMNNQVDVYEDAFTVDPFTIANFEPKVVLTGDQIRITGENFSPLTTNNTVTVGGLVAEVMSARLDELIVRVPLQDQGFYPARDVQVSVEILDRTKTFTETLLINDTWFRLPDFPGTESSGASCFTAGGFTYVGLNGTAEFWRFDSGNESWERMSDFTGVLREGGTGFVQGDYIYFGTGITSDRTNLVDFYKYSISQDSWTQIGDFPGEARNGASGFSINDNSYLTGGVYYVPAIYYSPYEDCWEFDPVTETWIEVPSFGDLEWGGVDGFAHGGVEVIGQTAYFGLGWNRLASSYRSDQRVFAFNPVANYSWVRIADFPEDREIRPVTFVLNNEPHFYVNANFYRYNGGWSRVQTDILTNINTGIGFAHQGKAYVGLGFTHAIWEYDQNR